MSRLKPVLLPVVLVLALPGWAGAASPAKARPLNLSLPRDVIDAPASRPLDENVERNLREPAPSPDADGKKGPALRYGAGYEHRHRQFDGGGAAAGGTASGSPAASGGAGGGGGRRAR